MMNTKTPIDSFSFRRIVARNVTLPLVIGVVTAPVFVGLIIPAVRAALGRALGTGHRQRQ
jgi:hypothetical protein